MEYLNTNDSIEQKLNEKCDRKGISIDQVINFFNKSRSNLSMLYQSQHTLLADLKLSFL